MLSETLKVCGLSTDPSTDCHRSLAGRCEEINKSEPVTSTGLLLHQYPVQTHGYPFLLVWVQIQVQFVITELQRCFRKFTFSNQSLNWTKMASTMPHINPLWSDYIYFIFQYSDTGTSDCYPKLLNKNQFQYKVQDFPVILSDVRSVMCEQIQISSSETVGEKQVPVAVIEQLVKTGQLSFLFTVLFNHQCNTWTSSKAPKCASWQDVELTRWQVHWWTYKFKSSQDDKKDASASKLLAVIDDWWRMEIQFFKTFSALEKHSWR